MTLTKEEWDMVREAVLFRKEALEVRGIEYLSLDAAHAEECAARAKAFKELRLKLAEPTTTLLT